MFSAGVGKNQIMIWFDLNGFLDLLIWFDLTLFFDCVIWFDLIWRLFKITWFDLTTFFPWFDLIWICKIIIDPFFDSKRGFRRNQWHRWKELAESFRSVPYLSMKPQFWPDYGLILVTPEILIWNRNQIMIWFELIWFDLTQYFCLKSWFDLIWHLAKKCVIWFDLRWSRFCVDLIWFEFAHPWFQPNPLFW